MINNKLKNLKLGSAFGRTIGVNKTEDSWLETTDPFKYVLWIENSNPYGALKSQRLSISGNFKKTQLSDIYLKNESSSIIDYSAIYSINENLDLTLGINNILNRKYYKWSSLRRAVGHGDPINERLTQPGRNFFISMITTF